jgi:predicted phosphodiesterase
MQICVISDLHISAGKEFDTFEWIPEDFILVLEHLTKKHKIEKIILNGDIYDLYQHEYKEIEEVNSKIIDYFQQEKFVYIRGNHDFSMPNTLQSYSITNSKNKIIYFEHGHQADFLNGTAFGRSMGRITFQLLKYFMRWQNMQRFFMKIVQINDKIDSIPRKYDTFKYLNYALKLLRRADFVVLSHTHKLEEHKTYYLNQKKIYVNTGSCSLGRFQCIILNTETLQYETIKLGKKAVLKKIQQLKENNKKKRIDYALN